MSDANQPTVAILTLGCKLNLADSEAMARQMRHGGWRVVEDSRGADAIIVNTCSVTTAADRKSRHMVRAARREAPRATVAVTGCLVETASPAVIQELPADFVYRQPDQADLTQRLIKLRPPVASARPGRALRMRAFVSAQEGCNDICAFCIVPRTRGRERSKPVAKVVAEVQEREAEMVQEVVITGTQLGAYGRDWPEGPSLHELLRALLAETSVARIRMSSVQPQDLSPQLLDLWANPRLCPHFHLALQSGSEQVLRRMRRRYTAVRYREAVERLRALLPDVAITTDVIAGFPGETEAEFEETFAFCREMKFTAMHVFPYSQRPGTSAARMAAPLDDEAKKARVHRLIGLAEDMSADYRRRYVGRTLPVLWESRRETNSESFWEGLTDTYVRVRACSRENLTNRLLNTRLYAIEGDLMLGQVAGPRSAI